MMTRRIPVILPLMLLGACTSLSEKSDSIFADKQPGLNQLDTITKDDKAEDAWYKSFYGSDHCGVSAGTCPAE